MTKPSKVIHVHNVGDEVSEIDLHKLVQPFRIIMNLIMLHDENQVFLKIQYVISSINALQYYTSVQPIIRGRKVYVQFSSYQKLTILDQKNFNEVKCSSLTNKEYASFYQSLINVWEDYLVVKHFLVKGQLEFNTILFMLKRGLFGLFGICKNMNNSSLWQGVFIMDDSE